MKDIKQNQKKLFISITINQAAYQKYKKKNIQKRSDLFLKKKNTSFFAYLKILKRNFVWRYKKTSSFI